MSRSISDCIGILKWRKEKTQVPEEWFMQAMRLKTKLYVWKAFPFGNVLGISNQKFCLNGKGPWCQFWELPQKTSSSRLVQNGSTLTKLELVTISSDKLNMLWPSFTLGSDMYYLFFSWHLSYIHTLPWPKTSQAQIWNQNIHSCQYPAGIFDLLSAFISCWFSSSLGHPTWYFFQS